MLITSSPNKSTCQVCKRAPGIKYARNQTARVSGVKYAQTRSNRIRVDWIPENLRERFGTWQGKLVCQECYRELSHAINS